MILNNGDDWQPEPVDVDKWKKLYPAINVQDELNKMEGWLDANPTKRKTPKGVKRFVNAWLARAQDKGGSPALNTKSTAVRQMSSLDDLSHNFTGDPQVREYFLQKYGQCYENGTRFTL